MDIGTPHQYIVGFWPNHKANKYIEDLIAHKQNNSKPYLVPNIAVKPQVFNTPKQPKPVQVINKEAFFSIVEKCSQMLLYRLLQVLQDEVYLLINSCQPEFIDTFRKLSDDINRYLNVHDRFNKWSASNTVKNVKAILRREYRLIFCALRREASAGNTVIPKKYGIAAY
jgi:hypothetical protein